MPRILWHFLFGHDVVVQQLPCSVNFTMSYTAQKFADALFSAVAELPVMTQSQSVAYRNTDKRAGLDLLTSTVRQQAMLTCCKNRAMSAATACRTVAWVGTR